MRDRRDDEDRKSPCLEIRDDHFGEFAGLGNIRLVKDDNPDSLGERTTTEVVVGDVHRQLRLDDVEVGERVTARFQRGAVDDVNEHRAPFDVAQELQPESAPLRGPGDQPRNIGDRETRIARGNHPKVGHERREGVVRNLGSGGRDDGNEGRLPRRGEADQGDIGKGFEFEDDFDLLAGLTQQREARGLASR